MTDISHKTWKYLHGPDDIAHLSFKTGAVPRSFTAIQYTATERDEIDITENGIAIIDNDMMSVVLDGHLRDSLDTQVEFMSKIRKLDWEAFSKMASTHPRYRGSQSDFGQKLPNPGVLTNQIQRGVMLSPSDETDLRSPSMVSAHFSAACPYTFPKISRSDALEAILSQDCLQGEDGRWRLSWSLPTRADHPYFTPTNEADENEVWQRYCTSNPEIFDLAAHAVTEPYFSGGVTTWPRSDAGRYDFTSGGISHPEVICLKSIDGAEVDFATRGEFGALMDALPDVAVRDIWKLVRVIDQDLGSKMVQNRISEELEPIRIEAIAALEPDALSQADLS